MLNAILDKQMDNELKAIVDQAARGGDKGAIRLDLDDPAAGQISVESAEGLRPYTLKPLDQLYEARPEISSIDPKNEEYMPLMLAIEGEIAEFYRNNPALTDGQAMLALKAISMNPAAPCGSDLLCQAIQMSLRLCLSLNPFSRQEVKLALRKVTQSVERHTKLGGRQGYVSFIVEYC